MDQILKDIKATVDEIKALRHLDHGEYHKRWESPEDRDIRERWDAARSQAIHASIMVEKKWDAEEPEMTVADGLPKAFADLQEQYRAAKALRDEYKGVDEALRQIGHETEYLGLEKYTNLHLEEMAKELLAKARTQNAVSIMAYYEMRRLDEMIDRKTREGTIVRRLRQAFWSDWRSRRSEAAGAAYQEVIDRLGAADLETEAEKAELRTAARWEMEVKPLAFKLQKLLKQAIDQGVIL